MKHTASPATSERFTSQLQFIIEIDKVKQIIRKTKLFDGSRYENDAEHSWHIAVMALVLKEYAATEVDIHRVMVMHLIHDLVEIYAGDTFLYAPEREDAFEREQAAAVKIFGLLPDDQRRYFIELWTEFEERVTPEARYAAVLDRIEPLLQNIRNRGGGWKEHAVPIDRVLSMNSHIAEGSPALWSWAEGEIRRVFTEEHLTGC